MPAEEAAAEQDEPSDDAEDGEDDEDVEGDEDGVGPWSTTAVLKPLALRCGVSNQGSRLEIWERIAERKVCGFVTKSGLRFVTKSSHHQQMRAQLRLLRQPLLGRTQHELWAQLCALKADAAFVTTLLQDPSRPTSNCSSPSSMFEDMCSRGGRKTGNK